MTRMKTPASPWRPHNRKVLDNPRGLRDPSKWLTAHGKSGFLSYRRAPTGCTSKLTCEEENLLPVILCQHASFPDFSCFCAVSWFLPQKCRGD